MKSLPILFFASVYVISSAQTSYARTVAVGNCRPHLVSYSTISEAVADVPPGSTVLVCPGTYPEQITISQPLTLKGLSDGLSRPVITVPNDGLTGSFPAQLSVQQPGSYGDFGPVNVANMVVDGSGFDASTGGELSGIEFAFASGSLDSVEVRNQTFGITAYGGDFSLNRLNIKNSSIHDFAGIGITTGSNGGSGFLLNLTSNWITSASPGAVGVIYDFAQGLAARNTITVLGQGLVLENYFCCMTARDNTITGSTVGIYSGGSLSFVTTTISGNSLFNNGTGIFVYGSAGINMIKLNTIVQSSTAAIDVDCSLETTAQRNTISGAPIGIANVDSGDTVTPNVTYSVPAATSACPF